jgi:cytochrome b pre-mRNA-processing protein 3
MMFFRRFFSTPPDTKIARDLYALIVAKARQPYFYAVLDVPDTVDGRFDMITLHAVLAINRLGESGPDGKALSQKLFDEMFADMDRSLREMGAGDVSIGKKVRRMAEVFYGRAKAYREALAQGDPHAIEQALARNVYPDGSRSENIARLARYLIASVEALAAQSDADSLKGRMIFPDPESADRS